MSIEKKSVVRGVKIKLNCSKRKGRTIHPSREVAGTDKSTGHLEGYRIPRGERKSNVEGRWPFLSTFSL